MRETLICPYCGHDHGSDIEHDTGGETVETDRDKCGKDFEYYCLITFDYQTSKLAEDLPDPNQLSLNDIGGDDDA